MAQGLDLVGNVRVTNVKYPKIFLHPKHGIGLFSKEGKGIKPKRLVKRQDERFFMFDVASLKLGEYTIKDNRFEVSFNVVKRDKVKELDIMEVIYHAKPKQKGIVVEAKDGVGVSTITTNSVRSEKDTGVEGTDSCDRE